MDCTGLGLQAAGLLVYPKPRRDNFPTLFWVPGLGFRTPNLNPTTSTLRGVRGRGVGLFAKILRPKP